MRLGIYRGRLPLRLDVMWTCSVDKWVDLLKAIVVVFSRIIGPWLHQRMEQWHDLKLVSGQ